MNATSATGQPFFAHHMPHQFMHQPSPPGMSYIPRHPGLQHPVFIQQHPHQGPMMVPLGQMPHGHYPDNAIYYGRLKYHLQHERPCQGRRNGGGGGTPPRYFQRTNCALLYKLMLCDEKYLFVQANVAVNTTFTSKVSFCFLDTFTCALLHELVLL